MTANRPSRSSAGSTSVLKRMLSTPCSVTGGRAAGRALIEQAEALKPGVGDLRAGEQRALGLGIAERCRLIPSVERNAVKRVADQVGPLPTDRERVSRAIARAQRELRGRDLRWREGAVA